jgi:hypothetical protein
VSLPTPARACALTAAALAATLVADQRVGLALALALLLAGTAGLLAAPRRPSLVLAGIAAALAVQPVVRDAGWVVAIDVIASLLVALVAAGRLEAWSGVRRALLAPVRLAGTVVRLRWVERAFGPLAPSGRLWPVARGLVLAAVLSVTFGALFASADSAFAEVVGQTFTADLDGGDLTWRLLLALVFCSAAAAIARAGQAHPATRDGARDPRLGRTELVIALSAVVTLFAGFVAVQLRVLFGGAEYVRATTGLGYGDYARQGFVQLLVVAALTLAVVAVAARRTERSVRGLLGALCALTIVVLLSAHHRLDLVERAYGLTRVRLTGDAVVLWLGAIFVLVLVAGCGPALARRVPRIATALTLAGVLAFSLSDPDARIAQRAVDRAASGGQIDTTYLSNLSADALPALTALPEAQRREVVPVLRDRLARPDGIAGLNLARARARR